MKKQEVIDLASRRGLCVYEQYKGRKVYYKVRIPVFEDEKEIPTSYRDELVRNIKEVKQLMRSKCSTLKNGGATVGIESTVC